jgi:hypothetical protein
VLIHRKKKAPRGHLGALEFHLQENCRATVWEEAALLEYPTFVLTLVPLTSDCERFQAAVLYGFKAVVGTKSRPIRHRELGTTAASEVGPEAWQHKLVINRNGVSCVLAWFAFRHN